MKFMLVFLLVVAAVAVTAQKTGEEGPKAVSASRSYGDSALVTLLKVKIGCLNRQMAVCENLLTTATRNCQLCECHHACFMWLQVVYYAWHKSCMYVCMYFTRIYEKDFLQKLKRCRDGWMKLLANKVHIQSWQSTINKNHNVNGYVSHNHLHK